MPAFSLQYNKEFTGLRSVHVTEAIVSCHRFHECAKFYRKSKEVFSLQHNNSHRRLVQNLTDTQIGKLASVSQAILFKTYLFEYTNLFLIFVTLRLCLSPLTSLKAYPCDLQI